MRLQQGAARPPQGGARGTPQDALGNKGANERNLSGGFSALNFFFHQKTCSDVSTWNNSTTFQAGWRSLRIRPWPWAGAWWCPGGWEPHCRQCLRLRFQWSPGRLLEPAPPPWPGGLCCMSVCWSCPAGVFGHYTRCWRWVLVLSFDCTSSESPEGLRSNTQPPRFWNLSCPLWWGCWLDVLLST